MRQESDPKKRKALVERVQAIHYEDVGQVKLGDYYTLDAARRELRASFARRRGFTFGTPGWRVSCRFEG